MNKIQELLLQKPSFLGSADLKRVHVFLSASVLAMWMGSIATAQQAQADRPPQKSLPGISILEADSGIGILSSASPTPSQTTIAARPTPTVTNAGSDIDRLLTRMVLKNIPYSFEETKDWGGQKERWDGIKWRREGLKIETQRRKKSVNHGIWKKYSAQLRNPNQEFTVQVMKMRETKDEKLAFDVHFQAHVNLQGRQSQWVKGVQLYSVGVDGHAQIRMVVSIELEVKMGSVKFPPDLVFVPRATAADLIVDDFRIDRIGKVGGEFTQQVSKGIRSKLDEKIAEKEAKLLEKINRQFIDKQDDLRISIADAIKSKWTNSAKAFLPGPIQDSLTE